MSSWEGWTLPAHPLLSCDPTCLPFPWQHGDFCRVRLLLKQRVDSSCQNIWILIDWTLNPRLKGAPYEADERIKFLNVKVFRGLLNTRAALLHFGMGRRFLAAADFTKHAPWPQDLQMDQVTLPCQTGCLRLWHWPSGITSRLEPQTNILSCSNACSTGPARAGEDEEDAIRYTVIKARPTQFRARLKDLSSSVHKQVSGRQEYYKLLSFRWWAGFQKKSFKVMHIASDMHSWLGESV